MAGNTSPATSVSAPDTTAPAPISAGSLIVSEDGKTVSGSGEPGSTVSVKDAGGKEIGTATVGKDGKFSATLDQPKTGGEVLSVTQTDMAGNTSPATSVSAPDTTAPAPISAGSLIVSEDGKTVSGSGEPGSTVSVKDAGGKEIGTATVGKDGKFSATLDQPKTGGEVLSVTQTDMAGNTSPATSVSAPDTTAPAPISAGSLIVSEDGKTVSGSGEPGSTVSVKDAGGKEIGTATVGKDGKFSATLDQPKTGGEVLSVTQTDMAGNTSPATSVSAPDTTAPAPISAGSLIVSEDGKTVSGSGEPGSTVSVKDAGGKEIGTATVGKDGKFSATLDQPKTGGEVLSVTQTDMAGNTSPATSVSAPDTTAPAPISAGSLIVSEDGKTVSGSGEPGSTVSVKDAGGKEIGTATVGKDGKFSATLDQPKTGGEVLSVTQTDMAGNTSPATSVSAPDTTAPAPISAGSLIVSEDGKTVSGSGEPGSTVSVKDAGGKEIGTATVGKDGKFSATLDQPKTGGEVLSVTQTDMAGNTSPATSVVSAGHHGPGSDFRRQPDRV
ncbi:Ig-like domain-containing protein [Serratia nematodiphila]